MANGVGSKRQKVKLRQKLILEGTKEERKREFIKVFWLLFVLFYVLDSLKHTSVNPSNFLGVFLDRNEEVRMQFWCERYKLQRALLIKKNA